MKKQSNIKTLELINDKVINRMSPEQQARFAARVRGIVAKYYDYHPSQQRPEIYSKAIASDAAAADVIRQQASIKQGVTLLLGIVGDTLATQTPSDKVKVRDAIAKSVNVIGRGWHGEVEAADTLLNMIDQVTKLRPEMLSNGEQTKGEVLASLWAAYAKLEQHRIVAKQGADKVSAMTLTRALDNAHYEVTDIPCQPNGKGKLFYKPRNRLNGENSKALPIQPHYRKLEILQAGISESLPDSELISYVIDAMQNGRPLPVWERPMAGKTNPKLRHDLTLARLAFDHPILRYRQPAATVDYGKATRCKSEAHPMPTIKPFASVQPTPEPITGGTGSGLPFDVPVAQVTQAKPSKVKAWYGAGGNPMAKPADTSPEATADNLEWLKRVKSRKVS